MAAAMVVEAKVGGVMEAAVEATAAAAMAVAPAADWTPRPHSSARHAAPSSPRSWRLHCRRPAQPGGSRLGQPLGNRRTSTQARRRVHSRRHALQAARIVCTTAHRTGRSGHAHPASLLSAGSRPSRATSCRMRRTCYRRSSPAPRKSASTDAATVVTAEEVRAAVRAGLLLRRRRAPSALAVRSASSSFGWAPTFGAGSGTHKQASKNVSKYGSRRRQRWQWDGEGTECEGSGKHGEGESKGGGRGGDGGWRWRRWRRWWRSGWRQGWT